MSLKLADQPFFLRMQLANLARHSDLDRFVQLLRRSDNAAFEALKMKDPTLLLYALRSEQYGLEVAQIYQGAALGRFALMRPSIADAVLPDGSKLGQKLVKIPSLAFSLLRPEYSKVARLRTNLGQLIHDALHKDVTMHLLHGAALSGSYLRNLAFTRTRDGRTALFLGLTEHYAVARMFVEMGIFDNLRQTIGHIATGESHQDRALTTLEARKLAFAPARS